MSVVGINEKKGLLSEVPKPPVYLTDSAKEHYKVMAKKLIKVQRLKEIYLDALEAYAEAKAKWEFCCRKIRDADRVEYGSGYYQKFKTGAIQNSTWVNQQSQAWAQIHQCCKMFGLDPASEKQLAPADPNQGNLFDQLKQQLNKGA